MSTTNPDFVASPVVFEEYWKMAVDVLNQSMAYMRREELQKKKIFIL